MDEYDWMDDLPHDAVRVANQLNAAEFQIPDSFHLPSGATDRFHNIILLLTDLERRRGIDTLGLLLAIEEHPNLENEDVVRAVERESKIKWSNNDPDRHGGRPSIVDEVAGLIEVVCQRAERGEYDGKEGVTRDNQIRRHLRKASFSRTTYYRIRDQVEDSCGIDLTKVAPLSEVGTSGPL